MSRAKNLLRWKAGPNHFWYNAKCPGCGKHIEFGRQDGKISVNIHSEGTVIVPGLYEFSQSCRNPQCEWSKIKSRWEESR